MKTFLLACQVSQILFHDKLFKWVTSVSACYREKKYDSRTLYKNMRRHDVGTFLSLTPVNLLINDPPL